MTLSEKLIELERLSKEVYEELIVMSDHKDRRPACYSSLNHRLIAGQALQHIQWLLQELGSEERER
jgi:hypothetical protein